MSGRDPKAFPHRHQDVWVSDLRVLRSGAGFYLGRLSWTEECGGLVEPYTRETGYMTEAAAEQALVSGQFRVRDCPENDLAYATGLPHPQRKRSEDFVQKVEAESARFKRLSRLANSVRARRA